MTQQAKHTPGPWTLKRGEGRYSDRLYIESHVYSTPTVTSGKDQIVQLTSLKWDDHGQEVEANARLIAAAPETAAERDRLKAINAELLAALKLVAKGIRSGHIEDQTILDRSNPHAASISMAPLSEIICAAIAKAERR